MHPSRTQCSIAALLLAFVVGSVWVRLSPEESTLPVRMADQPLSHPSEPASPFVAPAPVPEPPVPSPPPAASNAVTAPLEAPVAIERVRQLRQDLRWKAPVPEPAFAAFREWTKGFAAAGTPNERTELLVEGLELAEQRRNELADLIDKNPRRALELAVPAAVRRKLPAEIVARLEQPVVGRGDLWVAAAVPMPGKEAVVRPVQRSVEMQDGRKFDAFTFGQRDLVPTKMNIAVQGIALDGKLAMTELPGRVLEPVEVQELHAQAGAAPICPTSGEITTGQDDEVVVDWDGASHTFFCGPAHAVDAMVAASGLEAMAGGDGGGGPTAQTTYTEGTKKMLIIRVDFPDAQGQVVSDATLTTLINNMSTHWTEMSYGKLNWTTVGNGSAFTPTLRLPNGHASYTSFSTMLAAARTAATAAGYNYTSYDFDVVVSGSVPDVSFGGIAYVGGRGAWLANSQWNLGVCSHEVGHNFGLNHAGFWDTDDGTTIGNGAAVEYGNPFDQMGGASSSFDAHFGARQKNYLDWLVDGDVVKITADGVTTTRIRAFDQSGASGAQAIAVDRAGTTSNDYWIEYRQDYADTNAWMRDGVVLNWGALSISNMKPLLLDYASSTSTKDDSAILIGRTFSDPTGSVHITPVLRGADPNGVTWIDVTVARGTFAGNQKPSVTMGATNLNPAVSANVTFTATATDPDGDALAYSWDWGDGTFTANNLPSATKNWSTSGVRTVRCRVSDMRGQVTTGQVLVQVGTSSTFFIQGTVTTTLGVAVENVVVRADATTTDTTDSEGYYAITGLVAGSYSLTATKTGLSINPANFTNPITVGPSQQNVNFTAPPGSPYFTAMKAGLIDQGSNSGAVIVPVLDPDTPVTDLTLTASSSNPAVIPDASITFGTVGTTVRTITASAASNVSGTLNITITATDPQGGTGTYVWPVTVNARPVHSLSTKTTPENTPIDIDLRTLVSDDLTADELISYDLQRARNGTVKLLPDGYTARFTPNLNFNGTASFRMTTRDLSLGTRTLFLYDFEPPDIATDARSTDQSNFNRVGTLEVAGVGGEYSYTSDVPVPLAPSQVQSLGLSENTTGGARLRRTLAATDQNYNDTDWSFSAWVKRSTRDTEDFVFHLGSGDGHGTEAELELFFGANSDTLRLQKWGSGGLEKEIVGPNLLIGEWRHITLTYDRTGTNTGTFNLYVDGFAEGSVTAVAMNMSQTASLMVGGHNSTSATLDRWFDGKLDDVLFQTGLNTRAEIWGTAHFATRHYNGLSTTNTVTVNVTGTNQPPAVTNVPDQQLAVSGVSAALPFGLSDAESEARNLTVTAATSNAAVLPLSGIAISPTPPAWTNSDLGGVGAAGSLTEDHGTFILSGAGADIGGTVDEFRWVRQDLNGDGEIFARVASMDFGTNTDAKAGVMMRSAATDVAANALVCVTPSSGVKFQVRATDGAATTVVANINRIAAPCWVRLVRSGANFTGYYATETNGVRGIWQQLGTPQALTFAAAPNAFGLAVTSKSDATLCTAVFDRLGGTVKLGGERTVTLTPASGVAGAATVTLTASDGSLASTDQIAIMVGANAPPSISAVDNIVITDGTAIPSFVVTLGDIHTPVDDLTFSVISSNPLILPANRILVTGSGATRTITLLPIPSETGVVSVSMSSGDGSLTGVRGFTVTVNPSEPPQVLRSGANWRYFSTGGSPGGTWFSPSFNDAAWARTPGQFGYGEGDETTVIPGGPDGAHYLTSYYRRTFQIADASQIAQAAIRLLRDDGAVVYLNGVELVRDNMPTGTVNAATLALSDISGTAENVWQVFRFDPARFVTGTNTLAVEVHQASAASDDVSFDLQLLVYPHSAIPRITFAVQGADLSLLWPSWGSGWQLKSSSNLQAWSPVLTAPTNNGAGQMQLTIPLSGAPPFFRLEAP
jgi:hypothetical protein